LLSDPIVPPTPHRILAATDLSPGAQHAVEWASRLAQARGAQLHVVHAIQRAERLPVAAGIIDEEAAHAALVAERRAALDELAARVGGSALLLEGSPVQAVAGIVSKLSFDLVVVGRHGRDEAFLVGHVAERLVRLAPVSVVSVPPAASLHSATLRRVLCPTDLSAGADRALGEALAQAQAFGSEVHVLHVIDLPAYVTRQPDLASELERMVNQEVHALVMRHREAGARITEIIRHGAAGEVIATVADELDVDAILLPTHGRAGAARFFLGSVAERLIRAANRPVWTFRRGGAE
jgi:nucleotide-binding universal stress UspA family protein